MPNGRWGHEAPGLDGSWRREAQRGRPPGTRSAPGQQVASPVTVMLGEGHSLVFLALAPTGTSL